MQNQQRNTHLDLLLVVMFMTVYVSSILYLLVPLVHGAMWQR
jgi:hypothetical protein